MTHNSNRQHQTNFFAHGTGIQPIWIFRRAMKPLLILFGIGVLFLSAGVCAAQSPESLLLNKPIERTLIAGDGHIFEINLISGQFLQAVAESKNLDLTMTLLSPDGERSFDLLKYPGPEPLYFIAKQGGVYWLHISSSDTNARNGSYRLTASVKAAPAAADLKRQSAEQLLLEANALEIENTEVSLQSAFEKRSEARKLWHSLGDRYWEAYSIHYSARAASTLKRVQKALALYREALAIRRAIGDRQGQAATLNNLGFQSYEQGQKRNALAFYQQSLLISRNLSDAPNQASLLSRIGDIYDLLGSPEKAIEYHQRSLVLQREIGDRAGEAGALHDIGLIYKSRKQLSRAIEFYKKALPIYREVGDKEGEASTLAGLGDMYGVDEAQLALDCYLVALKLRDELGLHAEQGRMLNAMGNVYNVLGDTPKAMSHYKEALQLARAAKDFSNQGDVLNNLGSLYQATGEQQKALEVGTEGLELRKATGDRDGEASALSNIGNVYDELGERKKALEYHLQALKLYQSLGNRRGEARALNNLGNLWETPGDQEQALIYYNRALLLERAAGDRRSEAGTLNNIALIYDERGESLKALKYYQQALAINEAVGELDNQAATLNNIGAIYGPTREPEKALINYHQALALVRKVRDLNTEAITLHNLMALWEKRNPSLAIFYGKQSVNVIQQLRSNISGLGQNLQKSFLKSNEDSYHVLADLLIAGGRLPEAQQVLGLLKAEEYFEFVRGGEAYTLKSSIDLTPEEEAIEKQYLEIAERLTAVGGKYGELRDKAVRTVAEEQELTKLEGELKVANQVFQKFLEEMDKSFSASATGNDKVFQLRESQGLMETLGELGPGVVAIYTVVGEDKYRAILVTPTVQKAYETKISAADLNRKIFELRGALRNSRVDPRPLAQDLYGILVGPELAHDLVQAKVQTVMWSLDGVLRYLPVAALYDGRHYLVENHRNVVFTPASQSRLKDPVSAHWRALGLGVSKEQPGFVPLDGVPEELKGIIRTEQAATPGSGVMVGKVLLDEAFTATSMTSALRERYPVVHIASHFEFRPGNETNSFLLLGDGTHLSLTEIKNLPQVFSGVDLLTLSACNTATGGAGANGKEVEGFGVLAQRQGAKAVLATLWNVADESTQLLMRDFYRLRESSPELTKAEALRQAQLHLLRGTANQTQETNPVNTQTEYKPDPKTPYSHPYYWAPFILIGNWR
ncbi:MAG TPA: tetratricopeptide repeat protein [Pyrinomonadaceae bacterium]|nr:tetratricopeptide repeat protein [Pyrinomonadaceae bacterium]